MVKVLKKDWWIPTLYIVSSFVSQVMQVEFYLLKELVEIPFWYQGIAYVLNIYQFSTGGLMMWAIIYVPLMWLLMNRWGGKVFGGFLCLTQAALLTLCGVVFYPFIQYQGMMAGSMFMGLCLNVGYSFVIYAILLGYRLLTKRQRA